MLPFSMNAHEQVPEKAQKIGLFSFCYSLLENESHEGVRNLIFTTENNRNEHHQCIETKFWSNYFHLPFALGAGYEGLHAGACQV